MFWQMHKKIYIKHMLICTEQVCIIKLIVNSFLCMCHVIDWQPVHSGSLSKLDPPCPRTRESDGKPDSV